MRFFSSIFLLPIGLISAWSPLVVAQPVTPRFGAVRDVASDYFGVNQNSVQFPAWASNPLNTALAERLHLGSVRYPGGTVANYFDWRTGRSVAGSPVRAEFSYTLDDLNFINGRTGATPTFVLNMTPSGGGLENQMDLLREASRRGIAVDRVELGNEFYLGGNERFFVDGAAYGRTAKAWSTRVRELFPGAQTAAVAAQNLPSTNADSRIGRWNDQLFSEIGPADVDAVTLHYYGGSALGGIPTRSPEKWGTLEAQRAQHNALQASDGPARFVSAAFGYVNGITANTEVPAGLDLWITENNLFDRTGPARHTWGHGIYTAAVQAQMLRDPRITQTHFHNLNNQAGLFGLAFTGRDEFNGLLTEELGITQDLTTREGDLTASGYAMQMFGEALDGIDRSQRLFFQPTPFAGDDPAILGFRLFDDDSGERRIFLLNLSGEGIDVDTSQWVGSLDEIYSLSADPRRFVIRESDVAFSTSVLGEGSTVLQPWSLTLLRAPTLVPEPAAATLLVLFGPAALLRRRRRPA